MDLFEKAIYAQNSNEENKRKEYEDYCAKEEKKCQEMRQKYLDMLNSEDMKVKLEQAADKGEMEYVVDKFWQNKCIGSDFVTDLNLHGNLPARLVYNCQYDAVRVNTSYYRSGYKYGISCKLKFRWYQIDNDILKAYKFVGKYI